MKVKLLITATFTKEVEVDMPEGMSQREVEAAVKHACEHDLWSGKGITALTLNKK